MLAIYFEDEMATMISLSGLDLSFLRDEKPKRKARKGKKRG